MRLHLAITLVFATSAPLWAAGPLMYPIDGTPTPIRWSQASFPLRIVNHASDPAVRAEVAAALATWTRRSAAHIDIVAGDGTIDRARRDGVNAILSDSTLLAQSGVLGLASVWHNTRGEIEEVDVTVASGTSPAYDVRRVLEHEAGHLLGLDHSAVPSSVMYPWIGPNDRRGLDPVDLTSIASMYPPFEPSLHGVRGTVVSTGAQAPRAHVVLKNEAGGAVSAAFTSERGDFELRVPAPGHYTLVAEPLDGPVTTEQLSFGRQRQDAESFRTAAATIGIDGIADTRLVVDSARPTLNPQFVAVGPPQARSLSFRRTAVAVERGSIVTIAVSGDITADAVMELPPAVARRASEFRRWPGAVAADFEIVVTAPAGSAALTVRSPQGEFAVLPGAIRILEAKRVRSVR